MEDLSPKARAVVQAGRDPGVFTHADRDRIRRGLKLRLATLGAATTAAGTAAAMSITTKIVLLAAVISVVGGGAASLWALRGRAPAAAATATPSSPTETLKPAKPTTDHVAEIPLPSGPGPGDEVRKSPRRALATGAPAAQAPSMLDDELGLLRQAREELRTGFPGDAYQRLVEYERRHGKGPLWQERQALSAIALCQWRPGPQAQTRAAAFLRDAPQSPLAHRVRAVCDRANAAVE